jgi:hypothetical protein
MDNPRFNGGSKQRSMSHSVTGHYPRWVHVPNLEFLRDAAGSPRKRIFSIVSRPIPAEVEGKTLRRILIFNNHPDSLRLVLQSGADSDSGHEAELWRERRTSIFCGSILIAMVVTAMLWPLW